MLRRFVNRIIKLGFMMLCLGLLAGGWDFMQRSQAAEGDYTIGQYAASLDARYGDDVFALANNATALANTALQSGMQWADDAGVLEKIGMELPDQVMVEMTDAETKIVDGDAPLQVASTEAIYAPETSLFPRARVTQ